MSRRLRPHLAWGLLGAIAVPSLWYAATVPGALAMFACIGLAFVLWYRMTPRGAWVAMVLLGAGMSGLLAWHAAAGSRCPQGDTKVTLKEGKPPAGCEDIRAGMAAASGLFALLALLGLAAPSYVRNLREPAEDGPVAG